ncbi:tRNA (adenosine(37)-N6)-threonylcarbamoyltransferase complex transferase subunit TsaD [bacterium]|jgi:N6-L-threonylcarbamoyladenine synthase|nr:tRNA (adenosine(37)-N6)-threonylcarbamoyltransferase complex transferase subunit TsaD [bacterium]
MSLILGIETSCDECSASVLLHEKGEYAPLSVSTYSQIELHQPFGGVVPEVASRNHLEQIEPVIQDALSKARIEAADVDAIAVTNRPGLIGALLVGVTAAKALAYALKKPLVPVHHLEGHLMSAFLRSPRSGTPEIRFPAVFLMASGGHTHLHLVEKRPEDWGECMLQESILGRSVDDAAGEAFDKTAKILGFPYPGGRWIDEEAAKGGDPAAFDLPRGLKQKDSHDFSFSGLKTAVALLVDRLRREGVIDRAFADVCASIQEAIVDPLVKKTLHLQRTRNTKSIVIVGGVAANSRLRRRFEQESAVPVIYPDLQYCTDNAAMIAAAGAMRFAQGRFLTAEGFMKLNAFAIAEH